jgi:hypothetical protein
MPNAFALDGWVKVEHCLRRRWRRITEINAIAIGIAAEPEPETGRLLTNLPLDLVFALPDTARNLLGSSPKCRWQPTFAG